MEEKKEEVVENTTTFLKGRIEVILPEDPADANRCDGCE